MLCLKYKVPFITMEKAINRIPWNLIICHLKNELTDEEQIQLELWKVNPQNAELLDEIQTLWKNVQDGCATYMPDKAYYWAKLSKQINSDKDKELKQGVSNRNVLGRFYKYIAVACVTLLIGISFYMGFQMQQPVELKQEYCNLGGKSKIILPDGSLVWLNAHSSLSYDARFLKEKRIVKLNGEAYFDVAHNDKIPFIVNADGVDIEVHGTKFDVESFADDDYVKVSLREGTVSMYTELEERFLKPGEVGTYDKNNGEMIISQADIAFAISWAQEKLEFNNQPLENICKFLSKWYRVRIIVHPSLSQKINYTFTLRNEPLEEILRLMSRIHPITYQFDENNSLYIKPLDEK